MQTHSRPTARTSQALSYFDPAHFPRPVSQLKWSCHCRMSAEAVSTMGHCGERPSAKPISLSAHHKNRPSLQLRENFPGSGSTWRIFSNTTIWSDERFEKKEEERVPKKKKKAKPNLPTPKIFALLRKTKVIWFLFESIFGDTLLRGDLRELWSRHIISLWQENYPMKSKCLYTVYQQGKCWNTW